MSALLAIAAFVAVAAGFLRQGRRQGKGAPHERGRPTTQDGPLSAAPPAKGPKAVLLHLDRWQKRRRVWSFVFAVVKKFGDDRAGYLAALVSYYAFFSLLPLLLAMTSVLGFVLEGNESLRDEIKDSALRQIPFLSDMVKDDRTQVTGSVLALAVGVVASTWAGLRVIDAIQNALNEVWDVPIARRPNILQRRARGLVALGLLGLALLASVVASSAARYLPHLPGVGRYGGYVLVLGFNVGLFLVAFRVLSRVDHTWRELLPGSVLAALGWFVVQNYGAVYFTRINENANAAFRNLGGVLVALAFFFVVSQVVIVAAEVNVVLARRLWPRSLLPRVGELTDADERALTGYVAAERRLTGQQIDVTYRGPTGGETADAPPSGR